MITLHTLPSRDLLSDGRGLTLRHGHHTTPFGNCLLATVDSRVCHLAFYEPDEGQAAEDELRCSWPKAETCPDHAETGNLCRLLFSATPRDLSLHMLVRGTPFQLRVWRALLRIPEGSTTTYQALATELGSPGACRAVGSAVGKNPIAFILPCHRVLPKTGVIHHYRWGADRKKAILTWEADRLRRHEL